MNDEHWSLSGAWNAALVDGGEREMQVRDHLWASELGKAPIDVWLRLRATPPTNPANDRSKRKFESGNLFEWVVSLVLRRLDILKEAQKWSSYQYPGLMKVTGKADFIAGGIPDIERGAYELDKLNLPPFFKRAGLAVAQQLMKDHPNGLLEMPLEIKSVGDFVFSSMERSGRSNKLHRIQAYHYIKSSENYQRANLVYVSREDLRLMEFPIFLESPVEAEYKSAIEVLSKYHLANERPPLEKPIVFGEDSGTFERNYKVAYSEYLTMLYGWQNQFSLETVMKPKVTSWNRVLTRVKKKQKMTPKNMEILKEIEKEGFVIDEITSKFVDTEDEEKSGVGEVIDSGTLPKE